MFNFILLLETDRRKDYLEKHIMKNMCHLNRKQARNIREFINYESRLQKYHFPICGRRSLSAEEGFEGATDIEKSFVHFAEMHLKHFPTSTRIF